MTAPELSLVAEATRRVTAAQRRAARHVIDNREQYPTLDALAEAVALGVLAAEDDTARRVIVLKSSAGLFVYGPYATYETALKIAESGALGLGGQAAIVPLVAAPRSPRSKRETAPPKRPKAARPAA